MAKKISIKGVDQPDHADAANATVAPEPDATPDGETASSAHEVPADATEASAAGDGAPNLEDVIAGIDEALGIEDPAMTFSARIAELEEEKAQLKDRLLRALADAENTRRRAERDRKDAEAYGGTRLARDLLAVYDNLERALAAADDQIRTNHAAFLEGVELTRRELENAFAKHKIEKIEPGPHEKFDPNRHQAMFEAPVPGAPNGTIIEVMAPGFTIAERLLRPAMVGVARGAPQQAAAARPEEAAQPEPETAEVDETAKD